MIDKRTAEQWLQEEIQKAFDAGVPVGEDIDPHMDFPKAESFYGQCCQQYHKYGHKHHIRLSFFFLGAPEKEIRDTLMHEILHTVKGCQNHQATWRFWARTINRKYGYNIERCSGHDDFSLREAARKWRLENGKQTVAAHRNSEHKVRCKSCGHEWIKSRETTITLHPERYHCPCGGRIERVY